MMVPQEASICPYCRKQIKTSFLAKLFIWIIAIFILLSVLVSLLVNLLPSDTNKLKPSEKFLKMSSSEHLQHAKESISKMALSPAKLHLDAIPADSKEYPEAKILYAKIKDITEAAKKHEAVQVKASEKKLKDYSQKKFEGCRAKLKKAQKLDLLNNMDFQGGIPLVVVGPTFYRVDYVTKQGLADTINCFLMTGEDKYINFDMLDYRTNKVVAKYSYGKLQME